eukprot:744729-Prymnesium_polylepis.1
MPAGGPKHRRTRPRCAGAAAAAHAHVGADPLAGQRRPEGEAAADADQHGDQEGGGRHPLAPREGGAEVERGVATGGRRGRGRGRQGQPVPASDGAAAGLLRVGARARPKGHVAALAVGLPVATVRHGAPHAARPAAAPYRTDRARRRFLAARRGALAARVLVI